MMTFWRPLLLAFIWVLGLAACIACMAYMKETMLIEHGQYSLRGNEAGLAAAFVWSVLLIPIIAGKKIPDPVSVTDNTHPKGS